MCSTRTSTCTIISLQSPCLSLQQSHLNTAGWSKRPQLPKLGKTNKQTTGPDAVTQVTRLAAGTRFPQIDHLLTHILRSPVRLTFLIVKGLNKIEPPKALCIPASALLTESITSVSRPEAPAPKGSSSSGSPHFSPSCPVLRRHQALRLRAALNLANTDLPRPTQVSGHTMGRTAVCRQPRGGWDPGQGSIRKK